MSFAKDVAEMERETTRIFEMVKERGASPRYFRGHSPRLFEEVRFLIGELIYSFLLNAEDDNITVEVWERFGEPRIERFVVTFETGLTEALDRFLPGGKPYAEA
jgi:plasmid stabilization system protein ParE